jgi:accessory gene regulator B
MIRAVDLIVDWLVESGILKKDEKELYRYGYLILIERLINVVIAFIITFFSGKWKEVGLFLICFMSLRSYVGGWHAEKFWKCTIVTNSLLIILVLVVDKIVIIEPLGICIYWLSELLLFSIIMVISPVESENKPLKNRERCKYKKMALILWFVQIVVMTYFAINENREMAGTIMYTHMIVIIALVAELTSKKSNK